jgi:hypothetical protein
MRIQICIIEYNGCYVYIEHKLATQSSRRGSHKDVHIYIYMYIYIHVYIDIDIDS